MTKITLEKFLKEDYENYLRTIDADLVIADTDDESEVVRKLAKLEDAKNNKDNFVKYVVSLGATNEEANNLYSVLFEKEDFEFSHIEKKMETEDLLLLREKYETFCLAINKYIEPIQSQETFNHFLIKNGFDTVDKKGKTIKAVKSTYGKVTKDSPFASQKNNPKKSFLFKKIAIPTAVGTAAYGASYIGLTASKLAAGSKFLIFPVLSTAGATATAIGLTAAALTSVITPTYFIVKNKITRHYYSKKYGSSQEIINEKTTKIEQLMEAINETSLDLQKCNKLKAYFLRKMNRNRLHHIVNVTKSVVEEYKTIEAKADFDGKTEKLDALREFLTKVYLFSEENLNTSREAYKAKRGGTLENIDIFARLNVICDTTRRTKAKNIEVKKEVETDIFYNGLTNLAKFTNLDDAKLEEIKNERLATLPENFKLALISSEFNITNETLLTRAANRRKLGYNERQYRRSMVADYLVQDMINTTNSDTVLSDEQKAEVVELLLKEDGTGIKTKDQLTTKIEELKATTPVVTPVVAPVAPVVTNEEINKKYFEDQYTNNSACEDCIVKAMVITDDDYDKEPSEFITLCRNKYKEVLKLFKEKCISKLTIDDSIKSEFENWIKSKYEADVSFENFQALCNEKIKELLSHVKPTSSDDFTTKKREIFDNIGKFYKDIDDIINLKSDITDDSVTPEEFNKEIEEIISLFDKKFELIQTLSDKKELSDDDFNTLSDRAKTQSSETYEDFEKLVDEKRIKTTSTKTKASAEELKTAKLAVLNSYKNTMPEDTFNSLKSTYEADTENDEETLDEFQTNILKWIQEKKQELFNKLNGDNYEGDNLIVVFESIRDNSVSINDFIKLCVDKKIKVSRTTATKGNSLIAKVTAYKKKSVTAIRRELRDNGFSTLANNPDTTADDFRIEKVAGSSDWTISKADGSTSRTISAPTTRTAAEIETDLINAMNEMLTV